jgi:hypothetical protein
MKREKKPSLFCEGVEYKTQKAMTSRSQEILDSWELEEEHVSDFFYHLFKERHHACISLGEFPTKFKRMSNPRGPDPHHLYGFFPGRGWRAISWKKAISFLSQEAAIEKTLHNFFRAISNEIYPIHGRCQSPGCRSLAEDCHHVSPTFKEMYDFVRPMVSSVNVAVIDWFSEEDFSLPPDSKAVIEFKNLEKNSNKQFLCKTCHHKKKSEDTISPDDTVYISEDLFK